MWLWLALLSALLLGFYDIAKKHALRDNAVLVVLLIATACGSVTVLPLLAVSRLFPDLLAGTRFLIPPIPPSWQGLIAAKGALVTVSWALAYFSLKHLPISIVSPIRASAPVWTALGAVVIFAESPSLTQWTGLAVVFGSYYWLSLVGLKEGIVFHRNKWIFCIAGATLTGALSALYDKYLLQSVGIAPLTLQAWFSFYLVLFQGMLAALFWLPGKSRSPLRWRWTIPVVGLLLITSDLVYFQAVHDPEALIAVVSPLRRSSAVVSFVLGGVLFGEKNKRLKALPLAAVLAGMVLVLVG